MFLSEAADLSQARDGEAFTRGIILYISEVRYIRVAKIRETGHPDTETLSAIISLPNDVFCLFVISLKQHKFLL